MSGADDAARELIARKFWTYKGFDISPYSRQPNPAGFRWETHTYDEGFMYAQSKTGMRELINEYLERQA